MTVKGSLKDFSLPELFQILDQNKKTGLLTIRALSTPETRKAFVRYFWLYQGRVVAAADKLDRKGLLSIIGEQGWVSDRVASKLSQVCAPDKPMGQSLKAQGLLQADQLKLLFRIQVLKQICTLFELYKGEFIFDSEAPLPKAEMTGLSITATEATLMGLRALRGSTGLVYNLPSPASALSSAAQKPHLRLDAKEWQVWEFANGTVSLEMIAAQLQLSILEIQHIAFALMLVGLAEEVPLRTSASPNQTFVPHPQSGMDATSKSNFNSSLVQSFIGFLGLKV